MKTCTIFIAMYLQCICILWYCFLKKQYRRIEIWAFCTCKKFLWLSKNILLFTCFGQAVTAKLKVGIKNFYACMSLSITHLLDMHVGYNKSQTFSFMNLIFYLKNIFLKLTLKKASSYSEFKSLFQSLFWKVWSSFHVETITIFHIFWELLRFFELKQILKYATSIKRRLQTEVYSSEQSL